MREAIPYKDPTGKEPFSEWFFDLSEKYQLKVDSYLARLLLGGAKKNIQSLSEGVYELKIDYGPGLRVYFGQTKDVILLLGGDKGSQKKDIKKAKIYWKDYKTQK